MSDFETIIYTVTNRVATIRLNRPQAMNSFNTQLRLDLREAVERVNTDDGVSIAIITGEGRGFCAGADLKDSMGDHLDVESKLLEEYKPFLMAINDSDKLFIAAVNGACAGIGSALAMGCDLMVMADDAYIYQAFAAIGLIPDGGASYHLVNAMGYKKALQLFVESGRLLPDECLQYGLANKVVPAGELLAVSQSWAETLAQGSPIAQRLGKQVMKKAARSELAEVIDLEAKLQVTASSSEDSKNAVIAFFEKRKPVFQGR